MCQIGFRYILLLAAARAYLFGAKKVLIIHTHDGLKLANEDQRIIAGPQLVSHRNWYPVSV